MLRKRIASLGLFLSMAGCVPAVEPLTDPFKADTDKRLLGTWVTEEKPTGRVQLIDIDAPLLEGNPKSLMRMSDPVRWSTSAKAAWLEADWFFPSAIGKETYLNYINFGKVTKGEVLQFVRPGGFAAWQGKKQSYLLGRYRIEGNALVINGGSWSALSKLLKREGFDRRPGVKLPDGYVPDTTPFFDSPPGWLAAYLAKNGPGELFPKEHDRVFARQK